MMPPIQTMTSLLGTPVGGASNSSSALAAAGGLGVAPFQSPAAGSFLNAANGVGSTSASSPFSDLMTDAIGQVDQLQSQARTAVEGLLSGTGVDVHEAMIATEKAEMGFELVLSVRNKALAAYQQILAMQF
jgi:flagellar hook-basal body complex protein FliE